MKFYKFQVGDRVIFRYSSLGPGTVTGRATILRNDYPLTIQWDHPAGAGVYFADKELRLHQDAIDKLSEIL